jgi:hypothetical protein
VRPSYASSRLRGSSRLGLRLLRPGRLLGGAHFRLLERLRDRLRRRIWIWGRSGGGLDDTSTLEDVVPPLTLVYLPGREP